MGSDMQTFNTTVEQIGACHQNFQFLTLYI